MVAVAVVAMAAAAAAVRWDALGEGWQPQVSERRTHAWRSWLRSHSGCCDGSRGGYLALSRPTAALREPGR